MLTPLQICASVPAAKPFFTTYLPGFWGTISRGTTFHSDLPALTTQTFSPQTTFISANDSRESIMNLEKALQMPYHQSMPTAAKYKFPRKKSVESSTFSSMKSNVINDSLCIRITQTVELASARCSVAFEPDDSDTQGFF
jgi:hypothetical protein